MSTLKRRVLPKLRRKETPLADEVFNEDAAKKIISFWKSIGIKTKDIARLCRCSKDELVERFAHELDTAESKLVAEMATVVIKAVERGDVMAARWVLDRRGGPAWRRKAARLEVEAKMPRPSAADIPREPTIEDQEEARRETVRTALEVLTPEAREKLKDVVDEMRLGNAKLLN